MKRYLMCAPVALAIGLFWTMPAKAAESEDWRQRLTEAEEALKESMTSILQALDGFVSTIPQYEAPEVLDNGDIIIRRKDADKAKNEANGGEQLTSAQNI